LAVLQGQLGNPVSPDRRKITQRRLRDLARHAQHGTNADSELTSNAS
jgi:hypothetical protein